MTVICIGPCCIPVYSIIPFLLLFFKRIWDSIKVKVLGAAPPAADQGTDDTKKTSTDDSTIRQRRSKHHKGVIMIESENQWKELMTRTDPVVVDFTATWCRPCQAIAPFFKELSLSYKNCRFVKIDVDDMDELAGACNVCAMPTFQIYKKGQKVAEVTGADEKKLQQMVATHCT